MAQMDQYMEGAGTRSRTRLLVAAMLAEATTYFAAAVIGLLVVFIGLAIDAYRHNHGAGEESLLSFSNPGHVVAAAGLGIASVAVLAGLTLAVIKGAETTETLARRFVPMTGAWVTLVSVAVASIVYIASSGVTVGHGDHGDNTSTVAGATDTHGHENTGGDAGVAAALEKEGIDPTGVPGALTQGAGGEANGGKHDHGKHATFTQLTTMSDDELIGTFPAGTVTKADLPKLREEVAQVREIALKYPTKEAANAAGYVNTTSDVPFMGQHYLNFEYLRDGKFDPTKPEGLLFSKIDGGEERLVGVWFLLIPGVNSGVTREIEPAGFTGDLDLWHAHVGLCLVGLSGASEGETRETCEAKGGRFTEDLRWMMHVWVAPEATENPDGFFAYLNSDLFQKQQAAKQAAGGTPSGVTQ